MAVIIHDIVIFMNNAQNAQRINNHTSVKSVSEQPIVRHRLLNQSQTAHAQTTATPGGPIVYWMDRDMRLQDNWALLHALELATIRKTSLVIVYNLVANFLGGIARQWHFKLKALEELKRDTEALGIPFIVCLDETGKDSPRILQEMLSDLKASAVVTDFSPLHIQRQWKEALASRIDIPCIEVDAHNIVPAWITSQKSEYGAYTIRPKLYRLLPIYLQDFPRLKIHLDVLGAIKQNKHISVIEMKYHISTEKLHTYPKVNMKNGEATGEVDWIVPGEKAAHEALKHFLSNTLTIYGDKRNDPLANAQSNLSPYLHYGMISAARVALDTLAHTGYTITDVLDEKKNKAKVDLDGPLHMIDHVGAFLEELIVRRELADNFCLYNPDYDSPDCFPVWAQETLKKHKDDPREFTYTLKQFEQAKTHDDLWNAAQIEMVKTGKMHGYMRMYWAKKILEWSKDYIEAQRIAIYLNDTYELDGRDPNGYAGIAWSIGGVHDRAWFPRPIFGTVRYMARSGCEKKFDVDAYIARWTDAE